MFAILRGNKVNNIKVVVQQILYRPELRAITDSIELEVWTKPNFLFWYVSDRVGLNLDNLFIGAVLFYLVIFKLIKEKNFVK